VKKLIDIPDDWYQKLSPVLTSPGFRNIAEFISEERKNKVIFPHSGEVFRAFRETPFNKVKEVILGMDPYPTLHKDQPVACGLAFAPRFREFVPPSLRVIYSKIKETIYPDDLCFPIDLNLEDWAKQGVFLINAALTVEYQKAGSHLKVWEGFTRKVLQTISEETTGIIFCFWGKDAQKFKDCINPDMHWVLEAPHPVSAVYKGGNWDCNHFEEINKLLLVNHGEEIKWMTLPNP